MGKEIMPKTDKKPVEVGVAVGSRVYDKNHGWGIIEEIIIADVVRNFQDGISSSVGEKGHIKVNYGLYKYNYPISGSQNYKFILSATEYNLYTGGFTPITVVEQNNESEKELNALRDEVEVLKKHLDRYKGYIEDSYNNVHRIAASLIETNNKIEQLTKK